jgi:hypothetical protein
MNFMKAATTCKGKEILWLMPDGYIIAFCMSSLTCPPIRQFFLDQAFGSRAYGCVIWWWFLLLAYQFTLYMHSCLIAIWSHALGSESSSYHTLATSIRIGPYFHANILVHLCFLSHLIYLLNQTEEPIWSPDFGNATVWLGFVALFGQPNLPI